MQLLGGFSPVNAIKQAGSVLNPTGGVANYDVFTNLGNQRSSTTNSQLPDSAYNGATGYWDGQAWEYRDGGWSPVGGAQNANTSDPLGGGSAASTTVTMTSTTGVNVNDYVFGTGIGTNARVTSIDSATNITVSVANSGAVSGVLVFNQLPFETGLSATKGTKLQIRIVANATSATNACQYLRIDTVTTSVAQQAVAYPLDPVLVQIVALDASDSSVIEGARLRLEADTGGPLPAQESVTITRSGSTASVAHTAHGMTEGDTVIIRGAVQDEYNGSFVISNVTTNAYDYTVSGTPTTPATGTITASAMVLTGLTDASGVISTDTFAYTADQPVIGTIRKGSAASYYKPALVSGTITSTGLILTVYMIGDE